MSGSADPLTRPSPFALPTEVADLAVDEPSDVALGGDRVVARAVAKSYGRTSVLRGIDLQLSPRSLVAVAGSNGVGKTTLLGCLAGTIRHQGTILLDAEPVGKSTRGRIAYLPQRLRLPAASSGAEVMRLFRSLAARGGERAELPEGFLPDLRKPMGQLSGGQAQRVALAAVLQGSPDLILLDEPFANLDDDARAKAHELLRAHRDAGATVLVASPTALDLLAMIDRVLLLEDGRIGFDGAPSRYAGRLEMTIWVRPGDCDEECLAGLNHVLRARHEGEWLALECHEERVIDLLRDLELAGVPTDRVRLGGPTAEARVSASPGPDASGADR